MGPPMLIGGNTEAEPETKPEAEAASMGPPMLIGGNNDLSSIDIIIHRASMGPPMLIGGNADVVNGVNITNYELQWGHRC